MPIMPTTDPDTEEARRAWLLSREAARQLGAPGGDDERVRILENAHLILRAHAAGAECGILSLRRPVRDAIEAALAATFPGIARDEALEGLVDRLRSVAHPDGEPVPDAGAASFFTRAAASLAA